MSFHLLTKVQIVLLSNLLSPNPDNMDLLQSSFLPYINYYWLTSERFQVPDLLLEDGFLCFILSPQSGWSYCRPHLPSPCVLALTACPVCAPGL